MLRLLLAAVISIASILAATHPAFAQVTKDEVLAGFRQNRERFREIGFRVRSEQEVRLNRRVELERAMQAVQRGIERQRPSAGEGPSVDTATE